MIYHPDLGVLQCSRIEPVTIAHPVKASCLDVYARIVVSEVPFILDRVT
jgi:hypothetical protein